jgi:hypothetical protein
MPTVTDSFTRANETPLAGNWATGSGDTGFNLTTNAANSPDDSADRCSIYTGSAFGNDQSSQGKLSTPGTGGVGQGIGLCVRHAAGAKTYYRAVGIHTTPTNWEFMRFVGGASTSLVQFLSSYTDGDTYELRVTGPAAAARLELFKNGVSVQVFTDNSSLASGSPGLAYSTSSTSGTVDDWVGTDVFGAAAVTPTFNAIPFVPATTF